MALTPHARLTALIVAGAFFMHQLDSTIIATALPQIAGSFHVRALDLSIGITGYLLASAAILPLSDWLSSRYGSRNILLVAIAIFTVASLACGLAQELWQFVAARAVQGIGGALMAPVGRMVVLRAADKADMVHAIAWITWPALTAPVIGPALGGFITTYASWRWNFWINLPLGVLGAAACMKYIPNVRDGEPRDMDWQGFVLSASALIALLYGMESFAHSRGEWQWPLAMVIAGLILSWRSVRHLRTTPQPLFELTPLRVMSYAIANFDAGFVSRAAMRTTPFLLPLMFQLGFGLNAWNAGLLVLVYFAGNLGIKPATTWMLRRFGFRHMLTANGCMVGLTILAVGALTPATVYPVLIFILLLAGISRSTQFTCLSTLTFADVPQEQRGSAATLASMLNQVSQVAGVACSALLLNISQHLHGHAAPALDDFRLASIAVGVCAVLAGVRFLRLPRNAGAEVSGHVA